MIINSTIAIPRIASHAVKGFSDSQRHPKTLKGKWQMYEVIVPGPYSVFLPLSL